jgi:putative hydrolase of the HAD superfamily
MREIKHVFFDLDHTIWDFERNSQEALQEIFHIHQDTIGAIAYHDFYPKYKKINEVYWDRYRKNEVTKEELRVGRFNDAFSFFGQQLPFDFLDQFAKDYLARSPYKTNLFDGAIDLLNYLKPKYKLHIITNGFKDVQYIKLQASALDRFFDVVICSDEVGVKKPNPVIFQCALGAANASSHESIMIGDCPEADVKGALAVGMKAAWFNPDKLANKSSLISVTHLSEIKQFL